MRRYICVVVLALGLSGCTIIDSGSKFDSSSVKEIVRGETTEQEVLDIFGPPNQTMQNADDGKSLIWLNVTYTMDAANFIPIIGPWVGGGESTNTMLTVSLDANGIVQDFSHSSGQSESR